MRWLPLMIACSLACGGGDPSDGPDAGPADDSGLEPDAEVSPLECDAEVVLPVGRETCQVYLVHDGSGFGMLWNEFIPSTAEDQWHLSFLNERLEPRRAPVELGLRVPNQGNVASLQWVDETYVLTVPNEADREVWTFDRDGEELERALLRSGGRAHDVWVDASRIAVARNDDGISSIVTRFDRLSDRFWNSAVGARGHTSLAPLGDDLLAFSFGSDGSSEELAFWRVGIGGAERLESIDLPRKREGTELVPTPSGSLGFYSGFVDFWSVSLDAEGAIVEQHPIGIGGPGAMPVAARSDMGDIGVAWHGAEATHLASPQLLLFLRVDERGQALGAPVPIAPTEGCGPGSHAVAATPRGFVVASARRADFARARMLCRE